MNISQEDFITGGRGCIAVSSSSGSVTTTDFYCFIPLEDTVVSVLYHNEQTSSNVIDTYKLQGITLPAGVIIVANDGSYFSGIQLSSGSVILYKR
jgi:hypothetical protein